MDRPPPDGLAKQPASLELIVWRLDQMARNWELLEQKLDGRHHALEERVRRSEQRHDKRDGESKVLWALLIPTFAGVIGLLFDLIKRAAGQG